MRQCSASCRCWKRCVIIIVECRGVVDACSQRRRHDRRPSACRLCRCCRPRRHGLCGPSRPSPPLPCTVFAIIPPYIRSAAPSARPDRRSFSLSSAVPTPTAGVRARFFVLAQLTLVSVFARRCPKRALGPAPAGRVCRDAVALPPTTRLCPRVRHSLSRSVTRRAWSPHTARGQPD